MSEKPDQQKERQKEFVKSVFTAGVTAGVSQGVKATVPAPLRPVAGAAVRALTKDSPSVASRASDVVKGSGEYARAEARQVSATYSEGMRGSAEKLRDQVVSKMANYSAKGLSRPEATPSTEQKKGGKGMEH